MSDQLARAIELYCDGYSVKDSAKLTGIDPYYILEWLINDHIESGSTLPIPKF